MPGGRAHAFTTTVRTVLRQYSVILIVILAAVALGLAPFLAPRLAWLGLGWAAVAALLFLLTARRPQLFDWRPGAATILLILGALLATALLLRLAPYLHTDVPIGYDYGFYKATMDTYEAAAPSVPEQQLPQWIKRQFPPLFFVLHEVLHVVAGLDALTHLKTLFPLFSAGLLIPLYTTTRNYFGTGAGLVAAGFYTASFAQFTVFEYLYVKNVLALALLLLLFFALNKERWVLSGLLLGGLGLLHRPTFLLAAGTLAVIALYATARTRRWRGWATTAAVSVPVFLPIWLLRFDEFFGLGLGVVEGVGDKVGAAVPEGGGTFLNFVQYQNAAITYLPLALAGGVLLLVRQRALLPVVAFLLSFLNVLFHALFFNRFIIMLDLVALPLVTTAFLAATTDLKKWVRPTVLTLLLLLTAAPTIQEAAREPHPPYVWIDDDQRDGIHWIRDNTPPNATVLASNLDAPYVIAESERRTYGPGLFGDPHNARQWRTFFATDNTTYIHEFLEDYGQPLYLYHAEGKDAGLGTSKFQPPDFTLVYDEGGAKIWHYAP